eukprot:3709756-Prymnesium_polylepis.2
MTKRARAELRNARPQSPVSALLCLARRTARTHAALTFSSGGDGGPASGTESLQLTQCVVELIYGGANVMTALD